MNRRSTLLLLEHYLKELKPPSLLREYGKMAAQCAAEGVDHPSACSGWGNWSLSTGTSAWYIGGFAPPAYRRSRLWKPSTSRPSPR